LLRSIGAKVERSCHRDTLRVITHGANRTGLRFLCLMKVESTNSRSVRYVLDSRAPSTVATHPRSVIGESLPPPRPLRLRHGRLLPPLRLLLLMHGHLLPPLRPPLHQLAALTPQPYQAIPARSEESPWNTLVVQTRTMLTMESSVTASKRLTPNEERRQKRPKLASVLLRSVARNASRRSSTCRKCPTRNRRELVSLNVSYEGVVRYFNTL